MKKSEKLLLSAAITGLVLSSGAAMAAKKTAKNTYVMCHGVNSCKGHGQCGGKVDACSGKNGCEASLTCAGNNSCKGKGLVKMKKEACLKKGGKIAS